MDTTQLTPQQLMLYGSLIHAGIGLVLGLIPLILGFVKGNKKYGLLGLLAAIVGGAILGLFLSIPAAAIFSWLIVRKPKSAISDSQ